MLVLQSFCQLLSNFINSFLICNKIMPGYNFQVSSVLSLFVSFFDLPRFSLKVKCFHTEIPHAPGKEARHTMHWIFNYLKRTGVFCNQQMDNFHEFDVFPESSVSEIDLKAAEWRQEEQGQAAKPTTAEMIMELQLDLRCRVF